MTVIVDQCVVPIGLGVHLAPYIAACEQVLTEAGLKIQLHPNGTAIEGGWEPVFAAIKACHQAVHAMGCPRPYTKVKITSVTVPGPEAAGAQRRDRRLECASGRGLGAGAAARSVPAADLARLSDGLCRRSPGSA